MKKKVLFSIIGIALFAVAIGFGINDKKEASLTVKNIEALASHGGIGDETDPGGGYPNCCDEIWVVKYSGGTDTSVSCTTGGNYKCPICCVS